MSPKVVGNQFVSILGAFQGVWNDSQDLTKSAIFKTMGDSPGFVLKIGRFRAIRNSKQIFMNEPESCWKSISKHIGGFQGVWNDSRHLTKSAIFKTMGYSPGFLLKIGRYRAIRNSQEIFMNEPESSWISISKRIGGVSGSLERFPGLDQIRHLQNHGL